MPVDSDGARATAIDPAPGATFKLGNACDADADVGLGTHACFVAGPDLTTCSEAASVCAGWRSPRVVATSGQTWPPAHPNPKLAVKAIVDSTAVSVLCGVPNVETSSLGL